MPDEKVYLITGSSGFIGHHFINFLDNNNIHCKVIGADIIPPKSAEWRSISFYHELCDVRSEQVVKELLQKYKPDYILHFAAQSSVAQSWHDIGSTFVDNILPFVHIANFARQFCPDVKILIIGSSEEYGNVNSKEIPVKEDCILNPQNPYGIARMAQELLAKMYVKSFNNFIVMTRSFNHIGPGQNDSFAIPQFVKQIAHAKKNNVHCILKTGNLDVVRDFIDVRDAVRAYFELIQKGSSGEVYNICSGTGYSLRDIIDILSQIAQLEVSIEYDEGKFRPFDIPVMIGSHAKITYATGWKPVIPIHKTLQDIYNTYYT